MYSSYSLNSTDCKTSYLDVFAVGVIQFILSLLIISYAIILLHLATNINFNFNTALWTVIVHLSISNITKPIFKLCSKYGKKMELFKSIIGSTTILLFIAITIPLFYSSSLAMILSFGLFGGVFSKCIEINLKASVELPPQFFTISKQLLTAVCLLIAPNAILALINIYGIHFLLILAAISLNIIPFSLLIKLKKSVPKKVKLHKSRTKEHSIEMIDMGIIDISTKEEEDVSLTSSSSSEEDEYNVHNDDSSIDIEEKTSRNELIHNYYETVGVKILPNIPEESEDEDDDINEISTKRLSRISAFLQELNDNTPKSLSVTNLFISNDVIQEDVEEESLMEITKDKYLKKKLGAIWDQIRYYLRKYFLRILPRLLKIPYFYPILLSNCLTTFITNVVLISAPYFYFNRHKDILRHEDTVSAESAFLLTVIGFSWLFFLAGYPIFNQMSVFKTKLLFIAGLGLQGFSLSIVNSLHDNHFGLFSLTFGLSCGILSYVESLAHKMFCGKRNWKLLRSTLEICTGLIVIVIYLGIYCSNVDVFFMLSNVYWIYLIHVVVWIVIYIVQQYYNKL